MNVLYKNESLKLNILTALCLVLLFTTYIKSSALNLFGNYAMAHESDLGHHADDDNTNDDAFGDGEWDFRENFVSDLCIVLSRGLRIDVRSIDQLDEGQIKKYNHCRSHILNNGTLLNEIAMRSYSSSSSSNELFGYDSRYKPINYFLVQWILRARDRAPSNDTVRFDDYEQFASIFCKLLFNEDQNGYDNCENRANNIPLEGIRVIYTIYQKVFWSVLDTENTEVVNNLNDLKSVQMPYFPSTVNDYEQFVSIFCKLFNEGQYDNCKSLASDIHTKVIKEAYQRELHHLVSSLSHKQCYEDSLFFDLLSYVIFNRRSSFFFPYYWRSSVEEEE